MPWLYLALAIVSEVIGTSFLKLSAGFTKLIPSLIVVVCYALVFYLLALSLKSLKVGIAYAIWAGLGVALLAIIGRLFFHETINSAAALGIVLIIAGVVLVSLNQG